MSEISSNFEYDLLWTVHLLPTSQKFGEFYVNYRLRDIDEAIRDTIYHKNQKTRSPSLLQNGVLPDNISLLVAEVRVWLEEEEKPSLHGKKLNLKEVFFSVTHNVTERWSDSPKDIDKVIVTSTMSLAGVQQKANTSLIALQELSPSGRKVIKDLDQKARGIAINRYLDFILEAQESGYELSDFSLPEPVSVFISYRHSHVEIAEKLHEKLLSYGSGHYFKPFLDKHDIGLGDWRERVFEELQRVDVFMPLVTNDFAEIGSVSAEELKIARELLGNKKLRFAPVFVDNPPENEVVVELLKMNSGEVSAMNLQESLLSKKFETYLDKVFRFAV